MQNTTLESLLKKANELEKKFEWLQAAEIYDKAVNSLEDKQSIRTAEFLEKLGFSFYKAAFQAQDNVEFRKYLKQAILAYEKEIRLLKKIKENNTQLKIKHAHALLAYTQSWYQTNPEQKKELLSEWWTFENQVLAEYETAGDFHSIGKTCNDLMEYSNYNRMWLVSDYSELEKYSKQGLILAEKAIKALSKLNDLPELTRAYFMASWFYSWSDMIWSSEDEVIGYLQKCRDYANKAIELSLDTGDAWLISWSYVTGWGTSQFGQLDPVSAIEYGEKALEYGTIAKDKYLMGMGNLLKGFSNSFLARSLEDPDKQKESFRKARKLAQEAIENFQIIQEVVNSTISNIFYSRALESLAPIQSNVKTKQAIFENATEVLKKGMSDSKGWNRVYGHNFLPLSVNMRLLSETKNEIKEKRDLLQESESYVKKFINFMKHMFPFYYLTLSEAHYQLALVRTALVRIETNDSNKIELLNKAIVSIENSISLIEKKKKLYIQSKWANGFYFGRYYNKLGKIFRQIYSLSKEKKLLEKSLEAYEKTAHYFTIAETPTYVAESYWHIAQLYNQLGNFQKASKHYKSASETYDLATQKIPQLEQFYQDYSFYMQAWSQIEQAKWEHSTESYGKAKKHYEKAAELHEASESWSYLAPNYFAWASIEDAENLSRKENIQRAKQTFQKALEQFSRAEKFIKQKLKEKISSDEKEIIQGLFTASELRRKYCKARILMEEARLLDREGKYLQSSKSYGEASQKISAIIEKMDFEAERKELEYIAILCQAWEKMANAEEITSTESYLEAAKLFEQAKKHCYTKKASLWALGNTNFCRGLASGIEYQSSVNLADHSRAKSLLKSAGTSYLQAGFKNASEYAKATQRLFDAYAFMNQAENELDQEKRAKKYQMAENLLQVAAVSFMKAKQPEKTAQVQEILANVREEKTLAVSLSQVMKVPSIASTTQSFTVPTPTREASVGLEQFNHANVQANLVTGVKQVKVGESFCLSLEFVNAGKEPALLTRVEDFISPDFVVVKKPEIYRIEKTTLNMKGKQLAPLKLVEVKLTLQPSKKGNYKLNPRVHYLDELGQNKQLQLKTSEIKVKEVLLEDRVSTGTQELDSLLLGGIPEGYAVILTSPPSDEREYLIKNFLKAGTNADETTFYVSTEADGLEHLLEKPNFYLFLCNPKPKTKVPDFPNVYKLHSKTDLTNLSISLAKAYRNIELAKKKRICVEIVSDVLISHKAETTRRWISELITDLGSKGFIMLALVDPEMHPSEQSRAIINLFDGEISLTIIKDPLECKTSIRVEKLRNKDYIKNPICLI